MIVTMGMSVEYKLYLSVPKHVNEKKQMHNNL